MLRYAAIGAGKIIEGHTDIGSFSAEMQKELGSGLGDQMPEIFERSKNLVNQFQQASGKGDVAKQIDKLIVDTKARETPVMVRPFVAYKAALKAQQKAGAAGYSRGLREARAEAKAAMAQFKDDIAMREKFSAGDHEQVRKNLVEYINSTLPVAERGRFINRATKALKRESLLRDPTYRDLFGLLNDVEARAEEVYRNDLVDDIKATAKRAMDSPTVDLEIKRAMQKTLDDISLKNITQKTKDSLQATRDYLKRMQGQGKDVYMPQRILDAVDALGKRPISELPTSVIENLHNTMGLLERLGRMKFKNRMQAFRAETALRLKDILDGPGAPLEMWKIHKPQPGEKLSTEEKISNTMSRVFNTLRRGDVGHLPMDVLFDMLQQSHGRYDGPLFDNVRTPIDSAYDASVNLNQELTDPLREIIKRNKLTDEDGTRVGLWATLQQDGGEARALASGVTPATIDKLRKTGLNAGQAEAYDYMRQTLDNTLPLIQDVMYNLYNIHVVPVRNYFPWMREYEEFKPDPSSPFKDPITGKPIPIEDLGNFGRIAGNLYANGTTKLPQGFTLERLPDAGGAVRMDGFNLFERHIKDASRLIKMQPELKHAGEIVRNDQFQKKFGAFGQQQLNDWLTTVTTDGAGMSGKRNEGLQWVRKAQNRSLVFFNPVSNVKHASAIPQGILNAGGPGAWWEGVVGEHSQFSSWGGALLENFPQLTTRQAGDMSMQELTSVMNKWKTSEFADKWGFVLGKELDAINSRAVFIGRYRQNMRQAGLDPSAPYDPNNMVQRKAAYNAMTWMRRTVSSTLPKDVQPVLGRGMGYGGKTDWARLMLAFRQYGLERWSLMRYDIPQSFKSGNFTRGIGLMTAIGIAGYWETNIGYWVHKGEEKLLGMPPAREPESWYSRLALDTFSMVPYASNLVDAYRYQSIGIPLVDQPLKIIRDIKVGLTAKKPGTRGRALMETGFTGAEVAGVPGAGMARSLVMPWLFPPKEKGAGRSRTPAPE